MWYVILEIGEKFEGFSLLIDYCLMWHPFLGMELNYYEIQIYFMFFSIFYIFIVSFFSILHFFDSLIFAVIRHFHPQVSSNIQ